MSNVQSAYVPGVCNIGVAERKARRTAGWIGTALTAAVWVVLALLAVSPFWRLFVFLPAMLGASGFLQSAMSFCVNFGMRGVQNFTDKVGAATTVEDDDHRKRDRSRSRGIMLYSLLIAAAVAVIAFFAG